MATVINYAVHILSLLQSIINFEVDGRSKFLVTNPGSSSFLPFLLLAEVPEDQEEAEQAKNTHHKLKSPDLVH